MVNFLFIFIASKSKIGGFHSVGNNDIKKWYEGIDNGHFAVSRLAKLISKVGYKQITNKPSCN